MPNLSRSHWRKRIAVAPAFTLIEVLVVVAIIALLIAVLMPSLARARASARMAVCASNLHQFGVAIAMYQNQHREYVPRGGTHASVHWIMLVARQVGDRRKYEHVNQVPVERMPIYWCPQRVTTLPHPFIDYVINSMPTDGANKEVKQPTPAAEWPYPARVLLLGDAALESGTNPQGANWDPDPRETFLAARLNHPTAMTMSLSNWDTKYSSLDKMDFYAPFHIPSHERRRAGSKIHLNDRTNWLCADMHVEGVPWLNGKRTEKQWLRMFGVKNP